MAENPKAFMPYSHQDEVYEQKVLVFANKLRSKGVVASIDLTKKPPKKMDGKPN